MIKEIVERILGATVVFVWMVVVTAMAGIVLVSATTNLITWL